MITIVCGTNRPNSNSHKIAAFYSAELEKQGVEWSYVQLEDLPRDFLFADMFGNRTGYMQQLIDEKIQPASKFVFVIPEYNGGFPGVLKAFTDSIPPAMFHGKKAGLVGLSSGHTGSLRGMDQFSNVLNYLRVNVLFSKPKLSHVESLINEVGELVDERAVKQLQEHARLMVQF
ncbi:MAG: NAD(P)H-dependent oxidoreductase [Flavobacteriales bacterium]|nr:NAD(P)H-dependent oxidoreductase [Flavobacteriales bacterium]